MIRYRFLMSTKPSFKTIDLSNMDTSGLSEDDLDEYEFSEDEAKHTNNHKKLLDKQYDEVYEVSQDLSVAESFSAPQKPQSGKEQQFKNSKYDEAMDVSQSIDQSVVHQAAPKSFKNEINDEKIPAIKSSIDSTRSQILVNSVHDEAYEMSQSESDDSIDTQVEKNRKQEFKGFDHELRPGAGQSLAAMPISSSAPKAFTASTKTAQPDQINSQQTSNSSKNAVNSQQMKLEESSEGEPDESYDNIEGAYNPTDFSRLSVSTEIKDLFQYIERYKPHEVEIDSTLKCFIPDYLPAIGDIDYFVKIPRPDGKLDDLGLKVLDEPSTQQSDPTMLELQLRAMSKKLQYGDVAVRSIDNAAKNPNAIEKWIQSVNDLHRTKPPPHVTYKKNMPDIEKLMEAWPEDFEQALKLIPLPSPDLDMSLLEYVKVVCAILDIPVYDNPIESLHILFSLFLDFRNNPHFQARLTEGDQNSFDQRADNKSSYDDNFNNNGSVSDMLDSDYK